MIDAKVSRIALLLADSELIVQPKIVESYIFFRSTRMNLRYFPNIALAEVHEVFFEELTTIAHEKNDQGMVVCLIPKGKLPWNIGMDKVQLGYAIDLSSQKERDCLMRAVKEYHASFEANLEALMN